MAALGHEDQFRQPRLRGRCSFRKRSFAVDVRFLRSRPPQVTHALPQRVSEARMVKAPEATGAVTPRRAPSARLVYPLYSLAAEGIR